MNWAIKRTTDGMFWDDLQGKFVLHLTANCEFGTAQAVGDMWVFITDAGERVDIIRVFKGRAVT